MIHPAEMQPLLDLQFGIFIRLEVWTLKVLFILANRRKSDGAKSGIQGGIF
jgi:hypothetical protein